MKSKSLSMVALVLAGACGSDPEPTRVGIDPVEDGSADAGSDEAAAPDAASEEDASSASNDSEAPQVIEVDAEPKTCADVETTPVRSVPSVTFLVDGSGSMDCVYPEDPACSCEQQLLKKCTGQGSVSRWQALSAALFGQGSEPGVVTALGSSIRFGLWIYNNAPGAQVCPGYPAKLGPELNQAAQLSAAFPAKAPGYNTPTALALRALAEALPSPAQAKDQKLGPQKILLATDGQPFTCQDPVKLDKPALDYSAVVDATGAADAKEIDLYVMSLAPASGDFAAHLDEVAKLGGTQHAYTPANKAELSAALDEIIASAISCTVTLNGKIERPEDCRGRATLGSQALTCGDANGFAIRDASHVELLGEACKRFKHEPGIPLQMIFPCDGLSLQ